MSNDTTLKEEVRVLTGYDTLSLSNSELDVVLKRAKKNIRSRKDLDESEFDFYSVDEDREEALFWMTCLFAKIATGELGGQSINIAAVDLDTLLANEDGEVTQWYRNAMVAVRTMSTPDSDIMGGMASTSPARPEREYEVGTFDEQGSASSGTDTGTDL